MIQIEEKKISVLGKQLNVRFLHQVSGEGRPVLIFLHEGLGCIALWKDFPERLMKATGLNAIIYERQGYGQSDHLDLPRPDNYLEVEALDYLPALIQTLEIKKPILVGHSDGGTIALVYASAYPVELVLTAAAHVLVEDVTIEGIQAVAKQYDPAIMGKKLEKYHGEKAEDLFWAWANTWLRPSFRNWNVSDCLANISCPVLLLQGKEDEYATDDHLYLIANGIGEHARAFLIEDCKHVPHVQQKEQTLELMATYITEHSA